MAQEENKHLPEKLGNFSISAGSVTTIRLLRCFLGGLPTRGMVSLGVTVLKRLRVVFRGGALSVGCKFRSELREVFPDGTVSPCGSGLTTTIGGAGEPLSPEYRRSGLGRLAGECVRCEALFKDAEETAAEP